MKVSSCPEAGESERRGAERLICMHTKEIYWENGCWSAPVPHRVADVRRSEQDAQRREHREVNVTQAMSRHTNLPSLNASVCESAFHSRASSLNSHILIRCLCPSSILIEKDPWQASSLGHPLAAIVLVQNIIQVV